MAKQIKQGEDARKALWTLCSDRSNTRRSPWLWSAL